ncbi:MAG: hypothetical protein ABL867_06835 [Rickettsiales bacterium]
MVDFHEKKDELGVHNNHVGDLVSHHSVNDNHALAASSSQVDAPNRTNENPEDTIARLTKEAQRSMDNIIAFGGKVDGMPPIAGRSPADLQAIADVYASKESEIRDKASLEFQKNAMGGLAAIAGLGAVAASADKGVLSADAGVFSPEELEKRKDPIKFNAELEKILKEGGIDKEKLARTGVKTDGQDVDKGQNFAPTEVPNLKAAVAKQQESSGFERSRTA